jgi:hypothetical protein
MDQKGRPSPAETGDPERARILRAARGHGAMPRDLIAKLRSDLDAIGSAEHNAHGGPRGNLPASLAAIPALANFAFIVTSLQGNPLPPRRAEPEAVQPGHREH